MGGGEPYLEHDLSKLRLIILSEFLKSNIAELWEEYEAIPGYGVGHIYHLLLQDVQPQGHQSW